MGKTAIKDDNIEFLEGVVKDVQSSLHILNKPIKSSLPNYLAFAKLPNIELYKPSLEKELQEKDITDEERAAQAAAEAAHIAEEEAKAKAEAEAAEAARLAEEEAKAKAEEEAAEAARIAEEEAQKKAAEEEAAEAARIAEEEAKAKAEAEAAEAAEAARIAQEEAEKKAAEEEAAEAARIAEEEAKAKAEAEAAARLAEEEAKKAEEEAAKLAEEEAAKKTAEEAEAARLAEEEAKKAAEEEAAKAKEEEQDVTPSSNVINFETLKNKKKVIAKKSTMIAGGVSAAIMENAKKKEELESIRKEEAQERAAKLREAQKKEEESRLPNAILIGNTKKPSPELGKFEIARSQDPEKPYKFILKTEKGKVVFETAPMKTKPNELTAVMFKDIMANGSFAFMRSERGFNFRILDSRQRVFCVSKSYPTTLDAQKAAALIKKYGLSAKYIDDTTI